MEPTFLCPRCLTPLGDVFFYGPCLKCREALRLWANQRAVWRLMLGVMSNHAGVA